MYDKSLETFDLLPAALVLPRHRCLCCRHYRWLATSEMTTTSTTRDHHTSTATNADAKQTPTSRCDVSTTVDPDPTCRTSPLPGDQQRWYAHCWLTQRADLVYHRLHRPRTTRTHGCVCGESPCLVVEPRTRTADNGKAFRLCGFSDESLGGPTVRTPDNHNIHRVSKKPDP